MTDAPETPQIYLITPAEIDVETFAPQLAACLDATPVGCLRLALSARDEDRISRVADALREVAHARDVALVLESHTLLAQRLGLDGVHLLDGARSVRAVRKELGDEAIIGTFCGTSRHDGMTAGEAGVDYVSFGPAGATGLGDGSRAEPGLFQWWSEMIEVPVVAEGALDLDLVRQLAPLTDFFGIGSEIWDTDAPVERLRAFAKAIAG